MQVKLIQNGSTEKRLQMIASAGKLSQFPGNVFEVYEDSTDMDDNLKVIKRITKMGHKSIIEHDYFVFQISDVTPIVEQLLIGYRLTSFTIKSRRYVDFRNAGFYVPTFRDKNYKIHKDNVIFQEKYIDHAKLLFEEYSAMIDGGIPNEDARFCLPYSFYSNIVMGLNARELEKIICDFLYEDVSRIQEVKELGEILFDIVKEHVPYLVSFIENYKRKSNNSCLNEIAEIADGSCFITTKAKDVQLLSTTTSCDNRVLRYAIMSKLQCKENEACEYIEAMCSESNKFFKEKMMDEIIHSSANRELESVSFTFRIPISLSILTHLTRHRMHSLLVPSFTPLWDFDFFVTPQTISDSDFASSYEDLIEENKFAMLEFKEAGVCDEDLIYFYLGAQMCNVITTMNARELLWFTRMRCCNRAQWQIRDIANKMVKLIIPFAPIIARYCGPTCETEHFCGEGKKSCGRIKEILENLPKK